MSDEKEQLPYGEIIITEDGSVCVMVGARDNPRAAGMHYGGNGFKQTPPDSDEENAPIEDDEIRVCNMEDILKLIYEHYQEERKNA